MRRLAFAFVLFVTIVPAGAGKPVKDSPADPVREELAKLAGKWIIESYAHDSDGKTWNVIFDKDKREVTVDGRRFDWRGSGIAGGFTLDPTKRPKTVDCLLADDEKKGAMALAIYELNGNDLHVCIAAIGQPRPTEFTTPPGSQRTLLKLKRGK
jgi:uncharacterized protein (TIGR03067 family)